MRAKKIGTDYNSSTTIKRFAADNKKADLRRLIAELKRFYF